MAEKYMVIRVDADKEGKITGFNAYRYNGKGHDKVDRGSPDMYDPSSTPTRHINVCVQDDGTHHIVTDTVAYNMPPILKVGLVHCWDLTTDETLVSACHMAWSVAFPKEYEAAMQAEEKAARQK